MAVVTGAGRGIGRAIAVQLAAEGFHVVVSDLDHGPAVRSARACGGRPARADVRSPADMNALARLATEHNGRLDVWVNNAAVIPQGVFAHQNPQWLEHTWQVNIGGVVHGCQAALGAMTGQGSGHIVTVSSVCAIKPLPGLALYSATKAAVDALSTALRHEVRSSGIQVSTVLPYLVDTPAGAGLNARLLRPLTAEQVADAVVSVIRRPRARRVVPRHLGWILGATALLPQSLQDAAGRWMRLHELALGLGGQARAAYHAATFEPGRSLCPTRHPVPRTADHQGVETADD
ncbi:SDR family NAD(P)-dependent oxidoreductase [Streptomyces sp. NPDC054864]